MFYTRRQIVWGLLLTFILTGGLLGAFLWRSHIVATENESSETSGAETEGDEAEAGPEAEAEALRWYYEQRAYPFDTIKPEWSLRAQKQLRQARAAQRRIAAQSTWAPVGPEAILDSAFNYFRDSGRIIAIDVDPNDANHWLIGGANGGIWETRDSGMTWSPRTDDQTTSAVGAIAFAPSNPDIVYAGLGDAINGRYYIGGYGVLKSINGGATWQLVSSPPLTGTAFKKLYVHPTAANTLVGAANGRGRRTTPPEEGGLSYWGGGIYRSTDGGVSWALPLAGYATSLVVEDSNFNRQYAALDTRADYFSPTNFVLQRSLDGGQTWSPVSVPWNPTQPDRIELALAPSAPGTLYASVSAGANLIGLWRTDNAWALTPTWTAIPMDAAMPNGFCAGQCWFDHVISVDPANANTLYAGGILLWKCTTCGPSPTWTQLGYQNFPNDYYHVDQHSMTWSGNRLLLGNDGGLYSTTDGGLTWASHNRGLATNQMYAGSAHPTDPDQLLSGLQDIGIPWRNNNSNYWTLPTAGDGFGVAIAASNPDTHFAYTLQYLRIYRTTDGFKHITGVTGNIDTSTAPFGPRLEKCPTNDDVFIAGANKVWRTNNFFSSAPGEPTWSATSSVPAAAVTALAFAPSDTTCNTYAAGAGGAVSLTTNGGATWINLDADLPDRTVTGLAFDPLNPNILYVTLSGFYDPTLSPINYPDNKPGHVFKTTSATTGPPNWVNISPPVNLPHNVIVIDPQHRNRLYVGADLGVWETQNGGLGWVHHGPAEGMPNVAVTDLEINRATHRLYAFTYGRSAFMLDLTTSPIQNRAPYTPAHPSPADGAGDISPNQALSWQGGDPDNDVLTYTVAFGPVNPPSVVTTTNGTNYTPALVTNTTYYWAITASDGISTSVSATWAFTTRATGSPNSGVYLPVMRRE